LDFSGLQQTGLYFRKSPAPKIGPSIKSRIR
jgi:hypothetical protein